jgi:hypothetical protein
MYKHIQTWKQIDMTTYIFTRDAQHNNSWEEKISSSYLKSKNFKNRLLGGVPLKFRNKKFLVCSLVLCSLHKSVVRFDLRIWAVVACLVSHFDLNLYLSKKTDLDGFRLQSSRHLQCDIEKKHLIR